ncbi:MAG: recombinase family protein [Deltaproteobacteria bacterium]|nr:recombinase family protein [Deltaproteobacteria bacterium]
MTSAPTRVVVYARVSTTAQADEGVSLAAQVARCRAYADALDLAVAAVVEDAGASAATLDRPGLERALAMVERREADGILVAKLDRLTRSTRDLLDLVERPRFRRGRAALLSVGERLDTSSAAGRMLVTVLASIGQLEREQIAERTSTAMRHMRAQHRYTGGVVRYGFAIADDGCTLSEVPAEQAAIARARALRASGCSLRAVALALDEAGLRSRAGRPFTASAIASMLAA